MKKLLQTAALLAVGFCASFSDAYAKNTLPDGLALHVTSAPLQKTINDVGAFVSEGIKGTMLQMYYTGPEMLSMGLRESLGPIYTLLDPTRSAHFVISNPAPGEDPFMVLFIPVIKDMQKERFLLDDVGLVKQENGNYTLENMYLSFTDTAYAVLSDKETSLAPAMKLFKSIDTKNTPASGVKATLDIAQIMAVHKDIITTAIQSIESTAEMKMNDEASDHLMKALVPMFKGASSTVLEALNQTSSLSLYYSFTKEGIQQQFSVVPTSGSALSKAVTEAEKLVSVPETLNYLPNNAISAGYINISPAFYDALDPILLPMITAIDNALGNKVKLTQAYKTGKKLSGSAHVNAVYLNADIKKTVTVAYLENVDTTKYQKLVNDIFPSVIAWMKENTESFSESFQFNPLFTRNAGVIGDVHYDTFSADIKANPALFNKDIQSPDPINYYQSYAYAGNTFITTTLQGKGDLSILTTEAINNLKNKKKGIIERASFRTALSQNKGNMGFSAFYILDNIKAYASEISKQIDPMMAPMLEILVAKTPNSQVPLTMTINANRKTGFVLNMNIPTEAINETLVAGMKAYMELMMNPNMNTNVPLEEENQNPAPTLQPVLPK